MKWILIILTSTLCAFSNIINAQTSNTNKAPDIEKIRDFANSKKYDDLMSRFKKNDPTMSISEYRQLYYGYIFQPQYNPYNKTD